MCPLLWCDSLQQILGPFSFWNFPHCHRSKCHIPTLEDKTCTTHMWKEQTWTMVDPHSSPSHPVFLLHQSLFLPEWWLVLTSVSVLTRGLEAQKLSREPHFEKLLKNSDQSSKVCAHLYLSLASKNPPWGRLYKCPDGCKHTEKSKSTMGGLLYESTDAQHFPCLQEYL